ncbi:MAG: ABC transporter ATP-binding protein [Victivallales bacterium]|nr:ABC transporter ATP-binding protein [Victivallales bacterium]
MYRDFCRIFASNDRLRFLALVGLMMFAGLVELFCLTAVPIYVALLLGQYLSIPQVIVELSQRWTSDRSDLAVKGGIVLLLLFIARTLVFVFNYAVQERILRHRQIALGSRIYRAYMEAPWYIVRKLHSSVLLNDIAGESERLIQQFLDPMLNLLRNGGLCLAIVCMLMVVAPGVSLLAFALLGLGCTVVLWLMKHKMQLLGQKAQIAREQTTRFVTEGISVLREARILNVLEYFTSQVHASLERQAGAMQISQTLQKSLWPMMELLAVFVLLSVMMAMLLMGRDIGGAAPILALLAVSLARLKGVSTELMYHANTLRLHGGILHAIAERLDMLEGAREPQGIPAEMSGDIVAEHLTFAFQDAGEPVLKDITLRIPMGQAVAFVGPTGAGKTTMADLLLGLLKPTAGSIRVGGMDIGSHLESWQAQIGFVPQDIAILDNTIRANVALGIPDGKVDQNALTAALQAAHLKAFVDSLPDGDRTRLGERGTRLSGGQRQRLGIARALYRNPPVLIFDEATSALDNETEAEVAAAIEQLHGKHTVILVAHRLTTVRHCSTIFYFDQQGVTSYASLAELGKAHPAFVLDARSQERQ